MVRIAGQMGLPPGKITFDRQYAGWYADVTISRAVLHVWSDRGEFWATIECEGKTTPIDLGQGRTCQRDLEWLVRHVFSGFRSFLILKDDTHEPIQGNSNSA